MKRMFVSVFPLLVLILQLSFCNAQEKDNGLLAAPYPGSAAEAYPSETDPAVRKVIGAHRQTYYTKDPAEKVRAHYAKALGNKFEVSPEGEYIFKLDVIPFRTVVDIVTKRGARVDEGGDSFLGGTFAGVAVYGPPTNGNYSVIKVYDALEKAYGLRFLGADGGDPAKVKKRLEDPELKQEEAKYGHLKTAYFMPTDQRRKDNLPGVLNADEALYDKYYTNAAETRQKELEEVQKKYMDLMAKMQYDAANKLSGRMMELSGAQPDPNKEWETAIKCLEEMEKNAYATKIVIDTHPSKWDLTPPKN